MFTGHVLIGIVGALLALVGVVSLVASLRAAWRACDCLTYDPPQEPRPVEEATPEGQPAQLPAAVYYRRGRAPVGTGDRAGQPPGDG